MELTAQNMIITPKKFDINAVNIGEVLKNKKGRKYCIYQVRRHEKLTIQTPLMSAPFGISTYVDEANNTKIHN